MPLQIRRGTDPERQAMTVPLAEGEPLYTTDQGFLYIGNGTTPGGIQVTGYSNENAIDAVGLALVSGLNSGITFIYGVTQDNANRIDATVNISQLLQNLNLNGFSITGTGNINIAGTLTADFKGSVFGDDSTPLIDGVDSRIHLDGTVKGNIVPDANVVYDIGSTNFRFRDLYLSGSSIELGAATITAIGSAVNLPVGSTIGGKIIGTGSGNDDYSGNIIGDDSTIIVNTSTNTLSGTFIGDLKGSVFGDDSTIIVDAVNNIIRVAEILGDSGSLVVGAAIDPTSLTVIADQDIMCILRGITDGVTAPTLVLESSRGTPQFPSSLLADDEIALISVKSYDGSLYKPTLGIANKLTAAADMADANPESELLLGVSAGASNFSIFTFLGNGTFVAPGAVQLAVFADDTARSSAISTPVVGMMVFMTSGTAPTVTNKTVVYDGNAWVALH